jgi:tRNA(adenine34) deaminase
MKQTITQSVKIKDDTFFMGLALREAEKANAKMEVPIGAVGVIDDRVIARAHNVRESNQNPLGHSEILLITKLAKKLSSWRLNQVVLYVTLEPCLMCLGAIFQSRIKRLVFGAFDLKAGVCGSLYDLSQDKRFPHRLEVTSGVLAENSLFLLKKFFENLRKRAK